MKLIINPFRNSFGYSLPGLIMSTTVVSITILAIFSLNIFVGKDLKKIDLKKEIILKKTIMLGEILKDQSLSNTLNYASNKSFNCINKNTDCNASGNTYPQIISILSQNNTVLASRNAQIGFNKAGIDCNTFSLNSSDLSCPYRWEVSWSPDCIGTCIKPMMIFHFKLFTNKVAPNFNYGKYDFDFFVDNPRSTSTKFPIQLVSSNGSNFLVYNDGTVMSWGADDRTLGQGGIVAPATPGFVIEAATGMPLNNIANLGQGYSSHVCALSKSGEVYCWGSNHGGGLGIADMKDTARNKAVKVLNFNNQAGYLNNITQISGSAGAGNIALYKIGAKNKLITWGSNNSNRLAIDPQDINDFMPKYGLGATEVIERYVTTYNVRQPTMSNLFNNLLGLPEVLKAELGYNHSCVLLDTPQKEVLCWGRIKKSTFDFSNTLGKTGLAASVTTNVCDKKRDLPKYGGCEKTNLSLIYQPDLLDLVSDKGNSVDIVNPQVGLGDEYYVQDITNPNVSLKGVVDLAVLVRYTCAIVGINKILVCWGANQFGQLGRGFDSTSSEPPAPVLGLQGVTHISGKNNNICVRTNTGGVYCWGNNDSGQLGDGTSSSASTPVLVNLGAKALQVSAFSGGGCALLDDYSVKCWGSNKEGQLGLGTTNTKLNLPTLVPGIL